MNFEILSFVYVVFIQRDFSPNMHTSAQLSFPKKIILYIKISSYINFSFPSNELTHLDLGPEDTLEENAKDILFHQQKEHIYEALCNKK